MAPTLLAPGRLAFDPLFDGEQSSDLLPFLEKHPERPLLLYNKFGEEIDVATIHDVGSIELRVKDMDILAQDLDSLVGEGLRYLAANNIYVEMRAIDITSLTIDSVNASDAARFDLQGPYRPPRSNWTFVCDKLSALMANCQTENFHFLAQEDAQDLRRYEEELARALNSNPRKTRLRKIMVNSGFEGLVECYPSITNCVILSHYNAVSLWATVLRTLSVTKDLEKFAWHAVTPDGCLATCQIKELLPLIPSVQVFKLGGYAQQLIKEWIHLLRPNLPRLVTLGLPRWPHCTQRLWNRFSNNPESFLTLDEAAPLARDIHAYHDNLRQVSFQALHTNELRVILVDIHPQPDGNGNRKFTARHAASESEGSLSVADRQEVVQCLPPAQGTPLG